MTETKQLSSEARIQMTPEHEVSILKQYFKGDDHLLRVIRHLLFGLPVQDGDKKTVKDIFSNPEVKKAVRKKVYPIFEEDMLEVPVNSLADFWYGTEQNIIGHHRDSIYQSIQSKVQVKGMLKKAMGLLSNPEGEPMDLTYVPSPVDELGVNLLARNLYIKTVNEGINWIKIIANLPEEAKPEEQKKKAVKDSSK